MIKKIDILKYFLYFLLLVLIASFQSCAAFPRNSMINIDLLPFFITGIALIENSFCAEIFAVFVGIFADMASLSPDGLLLGYYLIAALCISLISSKYFTKHLPVFLVFGSGFLLIRQALAYVFYFRSAYSVPLIYAVKSIFLGTALSSVFSVALFFIIKKINSVFAIEPEE